MAYLKYIICYRQWVADRSIQRASRWVTQWAGQWEIEAGGIWDQTFRGIRSFLFVIMVWYRPVNTRNSTQSEIITIAIENQLSFVAVIHKRAWAGECIQNKASSVALGYQTNRVELHPDALRAPPRRHSLQCVSMICVWQAESANKTADAKLILIQDVLHLSVTVSQSNSQPLSCKWPARR